MKIKNQKTWLIVALIVVLTALILMLNYFTGSYMPYNSASPSPSPTGTSNKKPLSYTQTVAKYINRRIQFDTACQAFPSQVIVKNGTEIMLDNRAPVARVISLDTRKYSIAKDGFKIVTLTSAALPHNVLVDCGSAQNVAQILIQR